METYKKELFNLFMNRKVWTRKDTQEAYNYMYGVFSNKEVRLNEIEESNILTGITHLCDLLLSGSIYEKDDDEDDEDNDEEGRSTIIAAMYNLNVITEEEKKEINKYFYKTP